MIPLKLNTSYLKNIGKIIFIANDNYPNTYTKQDNIK